MNGKILCLPGDGAGTEIMEQAMQVLTSIACAFSHQFTFLTHKIGGASIETNQVPVLQSTLDFAKTVDAILLGPVGGPQWDTLLGEYRPEAVLSPLAKHLQLHTALIPYKIGSSLKGISPLRLNFSQANIDFSLVYPLSYLSIKNLKSSEELPSTFTFEQTIVEIEQTAHIAFTRAQKHSKTLQNVDQSHLFPSSRLWRETVTKVSYQYSDVVLSHLKPQDCSVLLMTQPDLLSTVLCEPLWAEQLAFQAGALAGSPALIGGMWVGNQSKSNVYYSLYPSSVYSAKEDTANPLGIIAACSYMLKNTFGLYKEADCINMAIDNVLAAGWRTGDIAQNGNSPIGTYDIGQLIVEQIDTVGSILAQKPF